MSPTATGLSTPSASRKEVLKDEDGRHMSVESFMQDSPIAGREGLIYNDNNKINVSSKQQRGNRNRTSSITPEDHDAHHHQDNHHGEGTVLGTTFNTITNVIGGGVLNFPDAMYQASMSIGIALCIFSSMAATFAVYILVKACDYYDQHAMRDLWGLSAFPQAPHRELVAAIRRKQQLTESNTEDAELDAFLAREQRNHRWRAYFADTIVVIMLLFNFGCLVLYALVIGESLPPVVHSFFGGSGIWTSKGTWLLGSGVIFLGFTCAKKLAELKWTSILGFVTILYVIIIIVVRYFTMHDKPEDMPDFNSNTGDVEAFEVRIRLANAMTTYGLAYSYHYNVPYYYRELKNRSAPRMMATVALSQPVILISYLLAGVFGYMTFGAAVDNKHSGGNIVDNYSEDDVAVNVGRFGLFFHFVCVYPIMSVACRRGLHHMVMTRVVLPYRASRQQRREDDGSAAHEGTPISPTPKEFVSTKATTEMSLAMLETAAEVADPPFAVIAAEAFGIVSLSILCAWLAPGIKLVVNIIGSLFGLFMMMAAPGYIGVRMFGKTRHMKDDAKYNTAHEQVKYALSWGLLIVGVVFIGTSFYTIVT